ncbi:aminotransferase class V-fold PLP-dependent enzyme [Streptomyces sp. DSM 44917]|uniref:Aminotransferase class V-fold PLP-dependent enzyme n=1 Tax=Streptomyces boetiae TaxID=3075541 RepID=A0ABU2L4Q3_9ACTN|nr:aminotransferase class V-fold PLP-dependent enzyme [Streptomyces sp. DSM 44917]MDT0306542.1 aminotransferase class V-fold PLP-dependent enzyme [Streptomyces sp. DSM 44917]
MDIPEGEYALPTAYLNTAAHGLIPARAVAALHEAVADTHEGRVDVSRYLEAMHAARASYARLLGLPPGRVAVGSSVSVHTAVIAASLPPGSEVLHAVDEFSSAVTPYATRPGLRTRAVPLPELAASVGPDTALVAVSAAQSLDGRVADLPALRAAASRHGARLMVDLTQAAGWLAEPAAHADFTVCAAYKWLLCPRGTAFLTMPEDFGGLQPVHAGWPAGEDMWRSSYGTVTEFAAGARRFDESPAFLAWVGAERALGLVEELGTAAIAAHDLALARRFREGLAALGAEAVPAESPIVAVPGLGGAAEELERAGVQASVRGPNLRLSFHVYNTAEHVDRALTALAGALPRPGRGAARA